MLYPSGLRLVSLSVGEFVTLTPYCRAEARSTCPSKTVRLTCVNWMQFTDRKEMYTYVLAPAHACVVTHGKQIRRLRRSDRTDWFVPSVKTDANPKRNSQRMTSGFGISMAIERESTSCQWRTNRGSPAPGGQCLDRHPPPN